GVVLLRWRAAESAHDRLCAALPRPARPARARDAGGGGRDPLHLLAERAVGNGRAVLLGEAAGAARALSHRAVLAHGDPHRHGGGWGVRHGVPLARGRGAGGTAAAR